MPRSDCGIVSFMDVWWLVRQPRENAEFATVAEGLEIFNLGAPQRESF